MSAIDAAVDIPGDLELGDSTIMNLKTFTCNIKNYEIQNKSHGLTYQITDIFNMKYAHDCSAMANRISECFKSN